MKALVTGGAGFIGSHLVDRLVADGHTVTVIDPADPAEPFPSEGVNHVQKRVQEVRLTKKDTPAVVYHLAGPVGPVGVLNQAGTITREIVEMGLWLQQFTCPVVFVSTSEVYGPQPVLPVSETANPIIVYDNGARAEYAAAKLATEVMLMNSQRDIRVIRPFNVAGPRQMPEGGFVLPRFIQSVIAGDPLTVYGDGQMVRAFTHVTDIVEGIYRAGYMGPRRAVYNLGNNENACTIDQLADEVIQAAGSGAKVYVDPVSLHGKAFREAPDKTPVTSKAWAELDWRPELDRATVISDTLEWWLER